MKKLIGIEREYFLVDKDGAMYEPAPYGFQIDEFGFLVEIRTRAHSNPEDLIKEFDNLLKANQAHAKSFGMKLVPHDMYKMPSYYQDYLSKRYHWDSLQDLTANVNPGTNKSHATGIDGEYGTAGMHVHFSCHNDKYESVQLPIPDIVAEMDWKFREDIHKAHRIPGEYEIKAHGGFEYRSLPASTDLCEVVNYAFFLLMRVTE
jgi:hypothetical protein